MIGLVDLLLAAIVGGSLGLLGGEIVNIWRGVR